MFPWDFFFPGEDHDADGPDGDFYADVVDEEECDGGAAPEDFYDGDGEEAVVLAAGCEGEGAEAFSGLEADGFGTEPADGDADDDEEDAEAGSGGEGGGVLEDFLAEGLVKDEAGDHDGEDDAHDAGVVLLLEDAGFTQECSGGYEEVDGEDGEDDLRGGDQAGAE